LFDNSVADVDRAAGEFGEPETGANELRLSRPDKPGDADNLSAAD
jgi:hypothetical protein